MSAEDQATEVIEATEVPRTDTFDYGTPADDTDAEVTEGAEEVDAQAEEEAPPEDTTEEVEYEGKQYKVDKALKEALMRQSDYTKKTQEVAESRRALEARQAQVEQQAQLQMEVITEIAQLHNIDAQLAEFAKINWETASQEDPVATQQLFIRQQNLKDARAGLVQSVQQKESQKQQIKNQQVFEAQQATAKQIEEGQKMLAREIKDWSPQLAAKLMQFAVDDGWTAAQIEAVTPAQVKSLHRAYVGSQLIQKQSAAPPVKPPPPPVPKVGAGGSASTKKVSEMSMEEYAKFRRSQRK